MTMRENDHERWMHRAIELTDNVPDLPFGAVIVHRETGEMVAEGWNQSSVNPTWHGEIDAINNLFRSGRTVDTRELILYTTAEPCPMCMGAILWSGIESVVFGTSIQFLHDIGWRQITIPAQEMVERSPGSRCLVLGGVLERECNELFLSLSRSASGR